MDYNNEIRIDRERIYDILCDCGLMMKMLKYCDVEMLQY